jgi:hypothetical protein
MQWLKQHIDIKKSFTMRIERIAGRNGGWIESMKSREGAEIKKGWFIA